MKLSKKFVAVIMTLIIAVNCSLFGILQVLAHEAMLDVVYDNCTEKLHADGVDEMWYILNWGSSCPHLSHEEYTIKYYFEEASEDGTYTWTTDVSEAVAQEIKTAYANSMKKWNNVYFYSYDSSGNVVKHKIINIVEGTASDHNLSIYPTGATSSYGTTSLVGTPDKIESGAITHNHYSEYYMTVFVKYYYVNSIASEDVVNVIRERTGAHEMGHILGLWDVDKNNSCNANSDDGWHHEELLMGYGFLSERSQNITYKDIAGVAITRGFHTDSDHRWLNCGLQSDGTYKLVCSICNGVKMVENLSGYSYNTYMSCNEDHDLSSGNMMAVASYGAQDYYKCKYCRYVAPFSSIVTQNYTKTYYSDTFHKCVNNVEGLEYTFYEDHAIVANECVECGEHIHSYTDRYIWISETQHGCICACGDSTTSSHVVKQGAFNGTSEYAICLLCKGRVFMGNLNSVITDLPHTENGSYILPNGIVVLVEEDIEAYMDGSLVFYSGEIE